MSSINIEVVDELNTFEEPFFILIKMEEPKENPSVPQWPSMENFKQPSGLAFDTPPRKAKEKKRCGDCKKTFIGEHFCCPKKLGRGRRSLGEAICQYCKRKYDYHTQHFRIHESKCKSFHTYIELKTLGDDRAKCKVCYRIFSSQGSCFVHMDKAHANLFPDQSFKNKTFVDDKTMVKFNCDLCKKSFRFQAALKQHVSKIHKDQNSVVPVKQQPQENQEPLRVVPNPNPNRECGFCSEMVVRTEFPEHFEKCRKASAFVQDKICKICKLRWGSPRDAILHVMDDHAGEINGQGADEEDHTEEIENQRALVPGPVIQEPVQNPNSGWVMDQFASLPSRNVDFTNVRVDPLMITKLVACTLCRGKFAYKEDLFNHMSQFHRVPPNLILTIGLNFKVINV